MGYGFVLFVRLSFFVFDIYDLVKGLRLGDFVVVS